MERFDNERRIFKRKGSAGIMNSTEAILEMIKEFVGDIEEGHIHAVDVNMFSNEMGIYIYIRWIFHLI